MGIDTGHLTLGEITAEIREVNIALGWRAPDGGICEGQTFGDYVALLHSEVSEALEAYRDHRLADATRPVCGRAAASGNEPCPDHGPSKPEGVGSELADVLIRLLDMADVWGIDLSTFLSLRWWEVQDFIDREYSERETFGDWMTWLHYRITEMALARTYSTQFVLRALVTTARHYGIDLEAEYRRKIAYNRTRKFQHGGRTLAGPGPAEVGRQVVEQIKAHESAGTVINPVMPPPSAEGRMDRLMRKIPDDDEAFWEPVQTKAFMDVWARLGLPVLTMYDASGESLTLWVKRIDLAANMLGAGVEPYGLARGFELHKGAYIVCVLQEG